MFYLVIICFFSWCLMLWLTYSHKLNAAGHIVCEQGSRLIIRDTPIARLFSGLRVVMEKEDIISIETTTTHVILKSHSSSIDIFINHRFIDKITETLIKILGEVEVKDYRKTK